MTDHYREDRIEKAFKAHEGTPTWEEDPIARDAAIRWHMRGFNDALAVFEQAHTPTSDEKRRMLADWTREAVMRYPDSEIARYMRQALQRAFVDGAKFAGFRRTVQAEPTDDERAFAWAEYRKDYEPNLAHFDREAVAFRAGWDAATARRTAVQEPGEREAKIHGELVTMRVKEWRRITDELARLRTMEGQLEEPEPGKRLDPDFRADLVDAASHRITDAWADVPEGVDAETLAQNVVAAQEFLWIARGFPVAVQEPQGEPTDAQVIAALNAYQDRRRLGTTLGDWGSVKVQQMRAALRAAAAVREEGQGND